MRCGNACPNNRLRGILPAVILPWEYYLSEDVRGARYWLDRNKYVFVGFKGAFAVLLVGALYTNHKQNDRYLQIEAPLAESMKEWTAAALSQVDDEELTRRQGKREDPGQTTPKKAWPRTPRKPVASRTTPAATPKQPESGLPTPPATRPVATPRKPAGMTPKERAAVLKPLIQMIPKKPTTKPTAKPTTKPIAKPIAKPPAPNGGQATSGGGLPFEVKKTEEN